MTTAVKEHPLLFSGEMVRAILDGRKTQTRRVVDRIGGLGRVTEFGPSDTQGYDWHARDRRMLWNDLRAGDLLGRCPYGVPGDRLWVREAWTADFGDTFSDNIGAWWHEVPRSLRTEKAVRMLYYRADRSVYHARGQFTPDENAGLPTEAFRSGWTPKEEDMEGVRWRPSIHMPRWASRITLEVTEVRVERVQEIDTADVWAEGIEQPACLTDPSVAMFGSDVTLRDNARREFRNLWDTINDKRAPWESNPWVWVVSFRRVA